MNTGRYHAAGTIRRCRFQVVRNVMFAALVLGGMLIPSSLRAQRDISKDYRECCERLVCQCGCNEQLTVCAMQNCSSATPMRAEIRERLQKGESVEQIVDSFVTRYGKQVLSAPTTKGFDLAAWIMPFVILCLGAVVVCWIAVKMARPRPQTVEPVPQAVDPRIEQELREFEEES